MQPSVQLVHGFSHLAIEETRGRLLRPMSPGTRVLTRATAYSCGRLPYPVQLFKKIREVIGRKAWVLDVGCGNGRSTIPLRKFCTDRVIGFDINKEMLDELAENARDSERRIPTKQGDVKNLSTIFSDKRFDAVTAFSAFTLFDDAASIQAIRGVLKPSGVFIDAGDDAASGDQMGNIMREVVKKALNIELIRGHDGRQHNEEKALLENGFLKLVSHTFSVEESYSFEQALANFKSRITYPKCSTEDEQKIQDALRDYFNTLVSREAIQVPVTYRFTVYKTKPQCKL